MSGGGSTGNGSPARLTTWPQTSTTAADLCVRRAHGQPPATPAGTAVGWSPGGGGTGTDVCTTAPEREEAGGEASAARGDSKRSYSAACSGSGSATSVRQNSKR